MRHGHDLPVRLPLTQDFELPWTEEHFSLPGTYSKFMENVVMDFKKKKKLLQ